MATPPVPEHPPVSIWTVLWLDPWYLNLLWPLVFFGVRLWWRRADHHKLDRARYWVTPQASSSSAVSRWGGRADRKAGTASGLDILRLASRLVLRRTAVYVRPNFWAAHTRWQRLTTATSQLAVRLARSGLFTVWAALEDVTVVFGGPRTGKTAWLAARIIDHPGALVVTSSRLDVLKLTWRFRGRRGPVLVFNPSGVGGEASTVMFDPLTGCEDPVTAQERAGDMVAAVSDGDGGDRAYWEAQARRVLGALLHAAALGGLDMTSVLRWVSSPDDYAAEIVSRLRNSAAPAMIDDVEQFISTNDKTRSSITSTIMPTLGWLSSPSAAAAGGASGTYAAPLNVEVMLQDRATIYVIGREEANTASLVAALTGHIAREARRIAALQGGRLDPPLGMHLDEAANICPVPLASWTSDFGGSGITILLAFQSRAQMVKRWGEVDAGIILNNAAAVMLFGGTKDEDDLSFWGKLIGDRDERVVTRDEHNKVKSTTARKVPVVSAPQLSNLPKWRVVVLRRGLLPCIGKVRPMWDRWDVRYAEQRLPGQQRALWLLAKLEQYRTRSQVRRLVREADAAAERAANTANGYAGTGSR